MQMNGKDGRLYLGLKMVLRLRRRVILLRILRELLLLRTAIMDVRFIFDII